MSHLSDVSTVTFETNVQGGVDLGPVPDPSSSSPRSIAHRTLRKESQGPGDFVLGSLDG